MPKLLTLTYRPDEQNICVADLNELLHLTKRSDPVWGWLNLVDPYTGRLSRRMSHKVANITLSNDTLRVDVATGTSAAGRELRRLHDECAPLALSPYLKGPTDDSGFWIWPEVAIISWDVHLRPGQDSNLDRIVRAIDRG